MHYFATLFDSNYLVKAIILLQSMQEHIAEPFHLFTLCLDDAAYDYWQQNPNDLVTPIQLSNVEEWDKELLEAKEIERK